MVTRPPTIVVKPNHRLDALPDVVGAKITAGSVTLDSGGIPYGTALVTVPLDDGTRLDDFDPRLGQRVTLYGDDGVHPVRTFDLGLRDRTVDYRTKTVDLTLATDEAMLTDYASLVVDTGARSHQTSLVGVVNYVLAKIGASLEPGAPDSDVTARWELTNLVLNPSYEVDAVGAATLVNSSGLISTPLVSPAPIRGTKTLRATSTAAGNSSWFVAGYDVGSAGVKALRVQPGLRYQYSLHLLSATTGRSAFPFISWRDANGVQVGPNISGTPITDSNTHFTTYEMSAVAPRGAEYAGLGIQVNGNTAGQFHYVDGVMFYEADELVEYFDGDQGDDFYTYSWDGTAHASSSTRVPLEGTERDPTLFTWNPGVTAWDFLEPFTSAAGLRLFCDERRDWRLITPEEYEVPGLVNVTPTNASEGKDSISREDAEVFATGVVVQYDWTDYVGIPRVAWDSAGTPEKVFLVRYARAYPGAGAAAAILKRRNGTGRTQDVEAIAQWDATPGMDSRVSLPDAPLQGGKVTLLRWDFEFPVMRVGSAGLTDIPANSWNSVLPTLAWNAALGTWNTFTTPAKGAAHGSE